MALLECTWTCPERPYACACHSIAAIYFPAAGISGSLDLSEGATSLSEGGSSNLAAAVGLAAASSTPVICSASILSSPSGGAAASAWLSGLLSCSKLLSKSQLSTQCVQGCRATCPGISVPNNTTFAAFDKLMLCFDAGVSANAPMLW